MAETSGISWTDATFNPWWGCIKVSPGCEHCYAESFSTRYGYSIWGTGPRRFFGEAHWKEPYKWNKKAAKAPQPFKVFSGSMCDIFEDRKDLEEPRTKLWDVIYDTENLIWLLLTKRPENVTRMVPEDWLGEGFPCNVWLGVTVENQDQVVKRLSPIAHLSACKFVSVEPMLGPVNLTPYWWAIDWVIVGGESGPECRPMDIQWARDLQRESMIRDVPFFMKQLGGFPNKRHDPEEWPEDLRQQWFPKDMLPA